MENMTRDEMKFQTGLGNNLDQSAHHETTLDELRREFDLVAAEWASLLGEAAAPSVRAAKETVQERPWIAVALAAAIGVVAAIALIPPRHVKRPNRVAVDLDHHMRNTHSATRTTVEPQPLSSRFVQVWDSIATLNASALPTLSPSTVPSFETLAGLAKSFLTTPSRTKSTT